MRTYVMQVATGRERRTIAMLEHMLGRARANFFAPRYRFRKKIKGSWELVEELLTPGYIYCKTSMTDIDELAQQIKQVPAFARVLAQDGKIIPLSADEERWLCALTGLREASPIAFCTVKTRQRCSQCKVAQVPYLLRLATMQSHFLLSRARSNPGFRDL